ncbi:MAG: hypothetical protein [Arizlama microvirus]|nr:MAG: hypothetical protein [Arizlama microvirus]
MFLAKDVIDRLKKYYFVLSEHYTYLLTQTSSPDTQEALAVCSQAQTDIKKLLGYTPEKEDKK